jgi:hypothetical protein
MIQDRKERGKTGELNHGRLGRARKKTTGFRSMIVCGDESTAENANIAERREGCPPMTQMDADQTFAGSARTFNHRDTEDTGKKMTPRKKQ